MHFQHVFGVAFHRTIRALDPAAVATRTVSHRRTLQTAREIHPLLCLRELRQALPDQDVPTLEHHRRILFRRLVL